MPSLNEQKEQFIVLAAEFESLNRLLVETTDAAERTIMLEEMRSLLSRIDLVVKHHLAQF